MRLSPVILSVLAMILLAGLGACSFGPDARAKHRKAPSPTPSGIYTIDHFDTCRHTDSKLLGSLVSKTTKVEPGIQKDEANDVNLSYCTLYMWDSAGKPVTLNASVGTASSIEKNRKYFHDMRYAPDDPPGMRDYTINGIGDEAYEKSERAYRSSTDMLFVIQGNLQVEVKLNMDRLVPRSTVVPKIRAIAQGLLNAATKD